MRKALFLTVMILFVCAACSKKESAEKLADSEHGFKHYELGYQLDEELRIIGEHQLYRISEEPTPGKIRGAFFLGIGGISQDPYTQTMHFAWRWRKANRIVFSDVSLQIVQFQIHNEKTEPTVEFLFEESWLTQNKSQAMSLKEAQKRNPNELLRPNDILNLVIVRISEKDLQAHLHQDK